MSQIKQRIFFVLISALFIVFLAFLPYSIRSIMHEDISSFVFYFLYSLFALVLALILMKVNAPSIGPNKFFLAWATPKPAALITGGLVMIVWFIVLRTRNFGGYLEMQQTICDQLLAIWFQGICGWMFFFVLVWGATRPSRFNILNGTAGTKKHEKNS